VGSRHAGAQGGRAGVFGREPECARIEQLLDRAPFGPVGIAIEGAPGIGKTSVWRHAVEAALARGYRVMHAAPSEADAALAFSGLGDLFDGLAGDSWAGLPGPQRRALGAALFVSDAGEAPADLDALPRAVLGVLRRLADESTVMLAIDDEQWLDRASARVVAFALRRIRDEQIGLLLSRRAGSDGALWPELFDGFRAGIEVIELAGLDRAATHRLLATSPDRKISQRLLERVHGVSGGNPLYALAIGAELDSTDGDARQLDQVPIPRTISDAIAQRLEHVRADAEAPLFAVAALADPTVTLLRAALDEFDAAKLEAAVRAGVIQITGEHIRFSHPLLASVHYASVPVPQRRELHRRLARMVTDPEERARHLALGAQTPDDDIAREIEIAGALAARRGAPESAAELLEHAIRLTPSHQREARWSRTIAAAEQHSRANDHQRVAQLLETLLLERPSRQISARARFLLGRSRTDDYEFVASMLDQALVDAGDDDQLRTEIEVVYVNSAVNLCDYRGMLRHAEAAVVSAERLGEPGPLASALAAMGAALHHCGRGVQHDLFTRAIELERSEPRSNFMFYLPSAVYGAALRIDDDLDAARPLLEQAVNRLRQAGEDSELTPMLMRLSRLEWSAGNPFASERLLAEAADSAAQQGDDEMNSWVAALRGDIAASRGQLDHARRHVEEVLTLASRTGDLQEQRDGFLSLANIELWSGRPEAAHELLAPRRREVIEHGSWYVSERMPYLWSSDIEALIALNRLDEAQQVLGDFLERATAYQNPHAVAIAWRCEGLVLAARGDLGRAIDALDIALAEHARRCLPLELGRTLLEKGSVERRAKHKTAAKETLERALSVLEPLGAEIWAARARDELGRVGLRRAVVSEGLTPAQERVAHLAAAGSTNREIAQTLYMSGRTVEAHLTKIYRELGIRSRAQLAAALSSTARTGNGDP
jgi:DNA-binding CsgD family transcriptional regulator